jgi:hypothetical protein
MKGMHEIKSMAHFMYKSGWIVFIKRRRNHHGVVIGCAGRRGQVSVSLGSITALVAVYFCNQENIVRAPLKTTFSVPLFKQT